MTDATDRTPPDEPPPDVDDWTGEPGDPDAAGPPAEFVNEPDDAVPPQPTPGHDEQVRPKVE